MELFGGGAFFTGGTPATVPTTFNGGVYQVNFQPYTLQQTRLTHNRDLSASYAHALGDRSRATVSYVHSFYDDLAGTFNPRNFNCPDGTVFNLFSLSVPQTNFEATDQFRLG